MNDEMLAGLNSSWAAWLEAMGRHIPGSETRQFGSVAATSIGVPIPMFNQVFVFDDPVADDLEEAVAWMRERAVPFRMITPGHLDGAVRDHGERLGLSFDVETVPGMVLGSLTDLDSTMPSHHVELLPVTRPDQLDIVVAATADGFGAPLEGARHMSPASMIDDSSMQWFVGTVDGESAACGQLLLTDEVAGVYSIAVIEGFRRRGIGEAITRALLLAGRERGASYGVLQASPLGKPVYEAMGFETITDYAVHVGGPSESPA